MLQHGCSGSSAAWIAPLAARRSRSRPCYGKPGSGNLTPDKSFNDRQQKILNRLLDGFEGKLTSSKWAKIAKCSQDTASRDIADLVKRDVLAKDAAGGRSTSYSLIETSAKTEPGP